MLPMFPRLARLFGTAVAEIEERHILGLVAAGAAEGEDLEFKSVLYESAHNGELAKDVSALANRQGGVIVIGVAERDGVAAEVSPVVAGEDQIARIRSVLLDWVHPMPPFDIRVIPSGQQPGSVYVLLVISRSPMAPHAVRRPRNESMRFALRVGSQTRWLVESEVADLYRNRFDMARSQRDQVSAVMAEGLSQIELGFAPDAWPWLALATVPTLPGAMEINSRRPRQLLQWTYDRPNVWPSGGAPFEQVSAGVGVGRIVLREQFDKPTRKSRGFHGELHSSGASFAACQLRQSVSEPLEDTVLARLCTFMVDLATAHAVENCGCWGDGLVELQLVEPERFLDAVSLSMRLGRNWGSTGRLEVLGGTVLDRGPSSRHTVDLSAANRSLQELVLITRMLLTDIVQAFGVAEPYQISSEGEIRTSHFHPATRRDVGTAAHNLGLLTTEEPV